MRIGFVHTAASLMDRVRADMASTQPHADSFHILNESLLQDLLRGQDRTSVYRRVVKQVVMAADCGADLIVATCSSTSPAIDIARQVCPVPVLKIDDPMASEAVRQGKRLALICTSTSIPGPAATLLRQHVAAQGREVLVEAVVRPEAYTALFAGDRARHDAIVTEAAEEAASRADVLVLGQASLDHLRVAIARFGKPVLSGPPLLMLEIGRRLAPAHATV